MLQDEGKLRVSDPVAKYIPEFANLKTHSGKPANITIAQMLTHTSGLGEADSGAARHARLLAEMIPLYLAAPMQYEPGAKWQYTQSGINTAARIVEIAAGMPFDEFVQKRILDPLGMVHTTFYPAEKPNLHLVTAYNKDRATGELKPRPPYDGFTGPRARPPFGNRGLYSTGPDYARFCQMLLGGGKFRGRRYLSSEAMTYLTTVQTGDIPTGFSNRRNMAGMGKTMAGGLGPAPCASRIPAWRRCFRPGLLATAAPGASRLGWIPSAASPTF